MKIFLVLILLSTFGVFGAVIGKKFEQTLPIGILGIVLILYVFYIMNHLGVGFYFLMFLCAFIYLLSAYLFVKSNNKKNVISNLITPGSFIFVACFVIIFIYTRNNNVLYWDELRLWAYYPKALYFSDELQLGSNALLASYMQSYSPGMPLFQYFITKVIGYFCDGYLFFAYALLGVATIISSFKRIEWKNWLLIIPSIILVLLLPMIFARSGHDGLVYYQTLFIDPMLGLYFGYSCYLAYKTKSDIFDYINYILSLITLVLLKDTGIIFALVASMIYFVKNVKSIKNKFLSIIPITGSIGVFMSWKIVQNIYDSTNMYTSGLELKNILSFIINPNNNQKDLINNFIECFFDSNILKTNSSFINEHLNYIFFFVLFLLLFILIIVFSEDKKEKTILFLSFGLGTIFFTVGLLFVYEFSIGGIACFPRYTSTIFTASSVLLALLMIECIKINKHAIYHLSLLVLSLVVLIFPYPQNQSEVLWLQSLYDINFRKAATIKEIVSPLDIDELNLVFLEEYKYDFNYTIYEHEIFYHLIEESIKFPDANKSKTYFIDKGEDLTAFINEIDNDGCYYFVYTNEEDYAFLSEILGDNFVNNAYKKSVENNSQTLVELW